MVITTIESVQGWLGNEISRLKRRRETKLANALTPLIEQELITLDGSIASLQKLKSKIRVSK